MAENRQNVIELATELIHRSGMRAVNVLRLDVTRADAPDQHRPLFQVHDSLSALENTSAKNS